MQAEQIKAQAEAMKAQSAVQVAQIKAQSDQQMLASKSVDQQLPARADQQLRLVALNQTPTRRR